MHSQNTSNARLMYYNIQWRGTRVIEIVYNVSLAYDEWMTEWINEWDERPHRLEGAPDIRDVLHGDGKPGSTAIQLHHSPFNPLNSSSWNWSLMCHCGHQSPGDPDANAAFCSGFCNLDHLSLNCRQFTDSGSHTNLAVCTQAKVWQLIVCYGGSGQKWGDSDVSIGFAVNLWMSSLCLWSLIHQGRSP